jgi:hypothetical protein
VLIVAPPDQVNYRRRGETGSRAPMMLAAIGVTAIVLGFFAVDALRNEPETFAAIVAIALLSIILGSLWKRIRPAHAHPPVSAGGGTGPPASG